MLRHNGASLCRQLGPHGGRGSYSPGMLARSREHVKQEEHDVSDMEKGRVYVPQPGGKVTEQKVKAERCSIPHGWVHQAIPEHILDLSIVFDSVEPGNIKPRPYTSEIVEPVSADPEKHPIPKLWWWHKSLYNTGTVSYAMKPEDVETEGVDGNPWAKYHNPGAMKTASEKRRADERLRLGKVPRWMLNTSWWKKGRRNPYRQRSGYNHFSLRMGSNPWWVAANSSDQRVGGKSDLQAKITPHWAFYRFLPILGYNGWGTKEGEISIENAYTEVGLDQIQWWIDTGMLNINERITPNTLVEAKLVEDYHWPGLKLVSNGCTWFDAEIDIEMENADKDAIEIVEKNKGTVITRWRDEEAIAKEKIPWRFPVIGSSSLPPEELIRDVYASDNSRGYLSNYYKENLYANPAASREWTNLDHTPEELGELPPEKTPPTPQPLLRSPKQVSLQKKQNYWEDYLAGKAGTADSRLGKLTPDSFSIWEYTYFHKQGPGHMLKREPPEGEEMVVFPGFPFRDSRYYRFSEYKGADHEQRKATEETDETPYDSTQMDRVKVEKHMSWELRGEGWRTEADAEIKYRNPYNNPYLKERIAAWQKLEKRKRDFAKIGKHVSTAKKK